MTGGASKYLIDSSCLVQAHRAYYPADVFPGFWDKLAQEMSAGRVLVLDKVKDEIYRGKDWLKEWLEAQMSAGMTIKSVNEVSILSSYAEVMNWSANHSRYTQNAKQQFAAFDYADPWLVACARAEGLSVVSQEISAPNSSVNIKLPDVCNAFKVRHLDTIGFLRETGHQF